MYELKQKLVTSETDLAQNIHVHFVSVSTTETTFRARKFIDMKKRILKYVMYNYLKTESKKSCEFFSIRKVVRK